jgi:quinol monooxygenase YgiN
VDFALVLFFASVATNQRRGRHVTTRGVLVFALCVRHELLPEAVAAFDRLVEQTLPGIRTHEPGTLVYVVGAPEDDPTARVFLEVYRDEEAFDRHNAQPYVQHFLAAREPMLAGLRVEFVPDCTGAMPPPAGPPSRA